MRYYAGLAVSLEETAICIVDETGTVVRGLRAASEPDALIKTLSSTGLGFEPIGLEACSLSSWLHQGLTRAELPALCSETRAAKAAMPNKTDRNSARPGADHPHRLVSSGSREEHAKPIGTRAARCTPHDAEQAA